MERIHVLDPTAPPPEVSTDRGPDAGSLAGRRIGIRYDQTWQSFLQVIDEWKPSLEAAGAEVVTWNAGNRIGEQGETTRQELDAFAEDVDLAIVGLGN
ncbi:hypothetical protein MK489_07365 [Myxococcota bacterium]|nr:hypothetical protein [Myxococcota bacterium]